MTRVRPSRKAPGPPTPPPTTRVPTSDQVLIGAVTGVSVPAGAVGLSVEGADLAQLAKDPPGGPVDRFLIALGPGVLRIGASSGDRAFFTSTGQTPPWWALATYTPAVFAGLRALLDRTNWRAVLQLSLAPNDPGLAASELQSAASILGPRLAGYEIGNEPDGYSSSGARASTFSYGDYRHQLDSYIAAVQQKLLQPPSLWGLDFQSLPWARQFASEQASNVPLATFTQHYYPLFACGYQPTEADLMSPAVRQAENSFLADWGQPLLFGAPPRVIDETNSIACGGDAASGSSASAVWAYDWIMRALAAGVAGLNFHGFFRDLANCAHATYSPICLTPSAGVVRPVGAALLAATQLEGGRFQYVTMSDAPSISVYALLDASGVETLSIVNFAAVATGPVAVTAPSAIAGPVTEAILNTGDTQTDNNQLLWGSGPYPVTQQGPSAFVIPAVPARSVMMVRWPSSTGA